MIAPRNDQRAGYEWIRSISVAELPENAHGIRPEFWKAIKRAVGRMKPSQRKVYSLYRHGVTAEGIAGLLGWKKSSVRARLTEVADLLQDELSRQNGSAFKFKTGAPQEWPSPKSASSRGIDAP